MQMFCPKANNRIQLTAWITRRSICSDDLWVSFVFLPSVQSPWLCPFPSIISYVYPSSIFSMQSMKRNDTSCSQDQKQEHDSWEKKKTKKNKNSSRKRSAYIFFAITSYYSPSCFNLNLLVSCLSLSGCASYPPPQDSLLLLIHLLPIDAARFLHSHPFCFREYASCLSKVSLSFFDSLQEQNEYQGKEWPLEYTLSSCIFLSSASFVLCSWSPLQREDHHLRHSRFNRSKNE